MALKNNKIFKTCALLFLLSASFNLAGCSTVKGIGEGFKAVGQGIKEDFQSMKKWDENFQENWW